MSGFQESLRALSFDEHYRCWENDFSVSGPAMEKIHWIWDATQFEKQVDFCGFSKINREQILSTYQTLSQSADFKRFVAYICYGLAAKDKESPGGKISFPQLPNEPGFDHGILYVVSLVALVPEMRKIHRVRDIPEAVTRDTLRDIDLWMDDWRAKNGGFGFSKVKWIAGHLRGQRFALGRLQYEPSKFHRPFWILRHQGTGQLQAIALGDLGCDGAGWPLMEGGEWTTFFHEDSKGIEAHPLHAATGQILRECGFWSHADWEVMIRPQDPVLVMHIPASGKLDRERVDASLIQAEDFFPKYFSEISVKAMTCSSWLMDPQLASLLPKDSNLVQFQNRFLPLPYRNATDDQTIERVFGKRCENPHDYPQTTTLQRIVAQHIIHGGQWRVSSGIRLFKK